MFNFSFSRWMSPRPPASAESTETERDKAFKRGIEPGATVCLKIDDARSFLVIKVSESGFVESKPLGDYEGAGFLNHMAFMPFSEAP